MHAELTRTRSTPDGSSHNSGQSLDQGIRILKVAIPAPLFKTFDYLIPETLNHQSLLPGCRVRVPFGRRTVIGLIVEQVQHSDVAINRLKPVEAIIDNQAVLPAEILALIKWAASYYLHPIGEVMQAALPALLKQGKPVTPKGLKSWKATTQAKTLDLQVLQRAPKQLQILSMLLEKPEGMSEQQLNASSSNWRPVMQSLISKKFVTTSEKPSLACASNTTVSGPDLNDEQHKAIQCMSRSLNKHHIHLLHGVTGSGKTEVYINLSQQVISAGLQVLVLVPEISLTPQLTERFQQRLTVPVVTMHSGLNNQQRLNSWYSANTTHAKLIIGTRSAIFSPIPDLGLIIIDEEHDGSYKQQEGFSYNARDLALVRAMKKNIPVILGSATPSLESLHNVERQRFNILKLHRKARNDTTTRVELIDLRNQTMSEGLSSSLLDKIEHHLGNHNQVLLFINRRGFSPLLMCHECGWTTHCKRCDAHMTFHKHKNQLHCHHCGVESTVPMNCNNCNSPHLLAIGSGTERIENFLNQRFPDIKVSRIDRDTTQRKGSLEDKLQKAHSGDTRILVGTQMLAKGHDFPNVTLVGVLDTDQALYSADFRASEHLAQLITQVSGRAGRAEKPGEVLIQTHHPDHPLLQTLLHGGYEKFAEAALEERQQAGFPPYKHLALLRCGAIKKNLGLNFMQTAADLINENNKANVEIFGPVPAPMEKRAGRYRTQIMLQSSNRKTLHELLRLWLPQLQQLKSARQVRWSIDIDPYDTY